MELNHSVKVDKRASWYRPGGSTFTQYTPYSSFTPLQLLEDPEDFRLKDNDQNLLGTFHFSLHTFVETRNMRVAIIGGGPSGLVQLKTLATAHQYFPSDEPFELKLFESYDMLGGVFLHHVYENAELVSSKLLTSFSDFRPRPEDNDFLSSGRYREYLEDYTTHFNLWPYIHLSTPVKGVRRGDVSEHVVSYMGPDGKEIEWGCDAIAACSGVHSKAHIPYIPGIDNVSKLLHSPDFKKREQFGTAKTIKALGRGETGCDMCYLAITSPTGRVVLCHRDGCIGAPKRARVSNSCRGYLETKTTTHLNSPSTSAKSLSSTPCMSILWFEIR